MDALLASPDAVRAFLDVTSDLLCVADAEGYLQAVSLSMSEQLGWTEAELKERPFLSFVHPLDVGETLVAYEALLSTGRFPGLVNRYATRDGAYRWFSWRAQARGGRVYAAATDVTALRAQADALGEEQARFRSAFEHSVVAKAITSAEGVWIDVNRALCTLLGYTPEALRGRSFREITHPDDLGLGADLLGQLFRGEIPSYRLEKRYLSREGRVVWADVAVTAARTPDGTFRYFLSEIQNITEAKAAQALADAQREALEMASASLAEARNAAQAADRAKGAFLAILSHELRAPLNALSALSARLQRGDAAADVLAEQIAEETRRLMLLMEEAVDFSHLDGRTVTLQEQAVDVRAVLGALVDAVRAHGLGRKVPLSVRVDERVPARVRADAARLQQLAGYLLENALRSTHHGAVEVAVTARLTDDPAVLDLHLAVSDSGEGYSPARLAHLLGQEPLDRTEASPHAPAGHSPSDEVDLRLTLVRRLAALMGGRMWAESLQGGGSTFHVTVRVRAETRARPAISPDRPLPPGLRVLVVEDVAVARKLACTVLERAGLTPDEATNGRAAVEQTRAAAEAGHPYDVVLMDVTMPVLDGLEATRQIRAHLTPEAQPQIIAVTADTLAGDLESCKRAGMDLYIAKPYTARRLVKAVMQAAHVLGKARNVA